MKDHSIKRKKIISIVFCYSILSLLLIIALFPFLHMLFSSLKPSEELFMRPPVFVPQIPTLKWYERVITYSNFFIYLRNSIIITVGATLFGVVIGAMSAYSLTSKPYKGQSIISKSVLIAYMFPPIILIIPLFQIVNKIGLANTHIGLILTYITFSFPFSTYLLISYFRTIPKDITEAAKIDGALNIKIFSTIILPLTGPAIVSTATYSFINSWNEFLYAFILANSDRTKTLPVALYSVKGGEMMEWGTVLSWCTMLTIPSLIFFFLISKQLVSGLTAGAVKG